MPSYEDWAANPYQFKQEGEQAVSYSPRYWTDLLGLQSLVQSGKGSPWDRQNYQMQMDAAQQAPMRDPSTLTYNAGEQDATTLSGGSPDLARIMFGIQDKLRRGTATDQERALYETTHQGLAEQTYRSVVPQESDQFNPLGDQFFGALGTLALGATGGLAGGALAAGGGLASTLGSLGTLSGIAGTGAGVLGQATDQEWLSRLGMGLGAAGGIAGGVGGLANLWSSGVNSLTDAARLASNAGRVLGGVGAIADNDVLKQAGSWLGTAGQLGGGADALANVLGGDSSALAPGLRQLGGGVQGLLRAAQQAQQRSPGAPGQPVPRTMSPADWLSTHAQPRLRPRTVLGNL